MLRYHISSYSCIGFYTHIPAPISVKERVTLTVDRDVLRDIDSRVDGMHIKNRSHAVELFLRKALRGSMPGTAVILAGGRVPRAGERVPLALSEIGGKPLFHYNIDLCRQHGIRNVILVLGPAAGDVQRMYGDGGALGVRITYVEEGRPLGTAGALRMLRDQLSGTFVLMNGDELKDINIRRMHQEHVEHEAKATIALTTVENPSEYGVAVMDGSRIVSFVEKPRRDHAPSQLINAGLYLLEPEVIDLVPDGFAMMETDVFPKLAKAGALYGYPFSGRWLDIGHLDQRQAKKGLKEFVNEGGDYGHKRTDA